MSVAPRPAAVVVVSTAAVFVALVGVTTAAVVVVEVVVSMSAVVAVTTAAVVVVLALSCSTTVSMHFVGAEAVLVQDVPLALCTSAQEPIVRPGSCSIWHLEPPSFD